MASIDISKTYLQRVHGDITAVYTWFNDERALVLIPNRRAKAPWFVVCESIAWRYDDPHYMALRCADGAEFMGMGSDRSTVMRVATIIHEGLPDLIRMPSFPDWQAERAKAAVGQLTVRQGGAVVHQEDITLPDTQGGVYASA